MLAKKQIARVKIWMFNSYIHSIFTGKLPKESR